jgi:hypothetical protein
MPESHISSNAELMPQILTLVYSKLYECKVLIDSRNRRA